MERTLHELLFSALGFLAGIGSTTVWYRTKGYVILVIKDRRSERR